ncbi:MAG: hypothetical protein QNJ98_16105 [Planctomycetota bacterium]|nr:hypothetical protein [Planctomycetota bacterium]
MTSSSGVSTHPLTAFGPVGASLVRTLEADRLASSYLFEGSDDESLREAALTFAASILAESPPGPPAGRAYELAMVWRHPDLHRLERDKATVISVAALTGILEQAHAKPFEGRHQVFVIEPAEAMEPEGIARYLKTLEEPPLGTVFLLLTTRADRLPDTVLSRCARLRFPPLENDVIQRRLVRDGVDPQEAQEAADCSGGSLGRARRIIDGGLCELAESMGAVGMRHTPETAHVVESVRAALEKRAKDIAAQQEGEVDRGRETVRRLLGDLIYVMSTDVRRVAVGDEARFIKGITAAEAMHLFSLWSDRAAAVHRNVTPALILFELVRTMRLLRG